jgi:hypothetical protein
MIDGLLAGITRDEIDRTPPAHRRRFAQALRRAVDMLERPHAKPPQEAQDGRAHLAGGRGRDRRHGHGWWAT